MWHTTGVDSVVFNTQLYNMCSDSNQSVQSGYSAELGASGTAILNKIPGILHILMALRERKTLFDLNSGFTPSANARKNFNEQLVWAAINKSHVGGYG